MADPAARRLPAAHPDIDIRIGAHDAFIEPGAGDFDVALRYCRPEQASAAAVRLFGEQITPVVSPWLLEHAKKSGAPLNKPADLAHHTLLEEDGALPSAEYLSWRHWLAVHGLAELQPARWLYFDYTLPAGAGRARRPGRDPDAARADRRSRWRAAS